MVIEFEFCVEFEGFDDIYVDWNVIGSGGKCFIYVGCVFVDFFMEMNGEVDVIVGIEKVGVLFVIFVLCEFEMMFGVYLFVKY